MDRRKFLIGATGAAAVVAGCSDNDENDDDAPEDDGVADEDNSTDTDESDDVGNETDDEDDGEDEDDEDGNETDDAGDETDDEYDSEETDDDEEFEGEEADDDDSDDGDDDSVDDDEDDSDDGDDDDEEDESDDEDGQDEGEDELDPDDYEDEIANDSPLEVAEFEAEDGCELTARITRPDGETAEIQYDFVVYYGDEIISESRNNEYELDGNDSSHELTAVLEGCDEATHYGFELHGYEAIDRDADNDIDGHVSMEGGTDNVFSIRSHTFDGQNCQVEVEVYNETDSEITGFVWVGFRGDRGEQSENTEIELEAGDTETITFGAQNCGEVRAYQLRGDVLDQ
ncbi:hypothetical protein [Natronococcus sp. A-GB7]|uniref:hypothetical protein n=1 Tax=Natronococcus sp. A-GB7 TaxID=3037649 RepID=UPI00241F7255|nr:hypothetical protein [Natronococcus sp. A-GB7]MDG5821180.1 hypothetical protein [Natronococcus sp. A-GB7]